VIFIISTDNLLGIAAIVASFAGVFLTVISVRNGRKDATQAANADCYQRLLHVQREAESLSEELYNLRMADYEAKSRSFFRRRHPELEQLEENEDA